MVRKKNQGSRGDGSELLFGNTVLQGSLDDSPSVANGCWWVIRVAVDFFDVFFFERGNLVDPWFPGWMGPG